jgi:ribosomal protein S7
MFSGSEFKQLIGVFVIYGFKYRAFSLIFNSLALFKKFIVNDPFKAFSLALESLRPIVGLRGKMIAGVFVKIPCLLSVPSANALVIHWVLRSLKGIRSALREEKLALEFLNMYTLKGFAFNQLRTLYLDILDNVSFLKFVRRRRRKPRRRSLRRRKVRSRLFWGLKHGRKKK